MSSKQYFKYYLNEYNFLNNAYDILKYVKGNAKYKKFFENDKVTYNFCKLYCYLLSRLFMKGDFFEGYETIAKNLNMSKVTVCAYVRLLVDIGEIKIVKLGRDIITGKERRIIRPVNMKPVNSDMPYIRLWYGKTDVKDLIVSRAKDTVGVGEVCYMTTGQLSAITGYKVDTLGKYLKDMERDGILELVKDGRQTIGIVLK